MVDSKKLQRGLGIGAGALQLAGSFANAWQNHPRRSGVNYSQLAMMNQEYTPSDFAGIMSQFDNTYVAPTLTGKQLFNPSSKDIFRSSFGAGMGSYGASKALTNNFRGMDIGTTYLHGHDNGTISSYNTATHKGTGELGRTINSLQKDENFMGQFDTMDDFNDSAVNYFLGKEGFSSQTYAPTLPGSKVHWKEENGAKVAIPEAHFRQENGDFVGMPDEPSWMYKGACGGHLRSCGGHKHAWGAQLNNMNMLTEGIDLASGFLGAGINLAAIANERKLAELDADKWNFDRQYLLDKQAHDQEAVTYDTKNNMFNMQAIQMKAHGGDLQTQGLDFPMFGDYNYIGTGGTHEHNPYQGVPQGLAADGLENLVEQDEVVWNDYVFSHRLRVPKAIRRKYKLRDNLTFSEAAEKLTAEAKERPNDPISQNGIEAKLAELQGVQEDVRMRKEAAKVKQQIAGMSPEELLYLQQLMGEQGYSSQEFALGGHLFATDGKMTRKEKKAAAEEAERKAQAEREAKARLEQLVNHANMSKAGLAKYAETLDGYNAADYNTTEGLNKLKQFVIEHGNYADFDRLIKENNELRLREGLPDFAETTTYDNAAYLAQMAKNRAYKGSSVAGVPKGHYKEDKTMTPSATAREDTQDYQDKTQYVLDQIKAMEEGKAYNKEFLKDYFTMLDSTVAKGTPTLLTYDAEGNPVEKDGKLVLKTNNNESAAERYKRLREDHIGGTFHNDFVLPTATTTGTRQVVRTKDADGNYVYVDIDPKELATEYPYLKETGRETVQEKNEDGTDRAGYTTEYIDVERLPYETKYEEKNEKTPRDIPGIGGLERYAPLLSPFFADYTARDYSTMVPPRTVGYTPIGDYLPYNPVDTQRYLNAIEQRGAARRSMVQNMSGANRNMALAQDALDEYQRQQEMSDLLNQAEQINFDRRAKVGEFNRGTNMFNAQAYNHAELANSRIPEFLWRQQYHNQQTRKAVDDAIDEARGQNISTFLDTLHNIGRENFAFNQANKNKALYYGTDIFGNPIYTKACGGPKKACGGMLTKRNKRR